MNYAGRPGLSPVVATLVATGSIRKDQLILDIGCGTGTDCILLAQWGFRHVVGVDVDPDSIRVARGRATRKRLGKRVRFEVADAEALPGDLTPRRVDVVLHTLVGNNLESGHHAHYRAIARAMKSRGIFITTIRAFWKENNLRPGAVVPVPGMRRYFDMSPSVSSHLAERSDESPGYTPVAVWIGRPRPGLQAGRRERR